jgi:hypothetical protein
MSTLGNKIHFCNSVLCLQGGIKAAQNVLQKQGMGFGAVEIKTE